MSRVPTYEKQSLIENESAKPIKRVTFSAGQEIYPYSIEFPIAYAKFLPASDKSLVPRISSVSEVLENGKFVEGNPDGVSSDDVQMYFRTGGYYGGSTGVIVRNLRRTGSINQEKTYLVNTVGWYNRTVNETVFKVKHNGKNYDKIKLNGKVITPKA